MEYPGTKFTKPWRITVLVVFVTAFFVLAPAIVLYTIGYRYDWQNQQLRQTGALSIDVNPKTGQFMLDENVLDKNTINKKIEIKNIKKGKYNLTIKTPGFYEWKKEIEIENKQTNYVKEINLIKKNVANKLLDKDIEQFWLSADFSYIIFTSISKKELEVWLYTIAESKTNLLFKTKPENNLEINWAKQYSCATLTENKNYNKTNVLCINPTASLTQLPTTSSTINKIQWKDGSVPELNYSTEKQILAWLPTVKQAKQITTNEFLDWYMAGNELWIMQTNTGSQQYTITKDALGFANEISQIKIARPDKKETQLNLLYARDSTALLKQVDEDKMIIVNEKTKHLISGDNFYISPYNDWWLIWTPWELWTYIEGKAPELQNRSGDNLLSAVPLDEYNALALMWKTKTTALFPYYFVSHELINTSTKKIASDSEKRILYFNKIDESGLWALAY